MPLTSISAYRQAGFTIDDEDVFEDANIETSKQATRSLLVTYPGASIRGDTADLTKVVDIDAGGVTFPNSASTDGYISFPLPAEYDSGNLTLKIIWTQQSTGSGNVKFSVDWTGAKAGDAITPVEETVTVTTAAPAAASTITISSLTLDAQYVTAGDVIGIKITRDPADAADTLAEDVYVIALSIEYTGRG